MEKPQKPARSDIPFGRGLFLAADHFSNNEYDRKVFRVLEIRGQTHEAFIYEGFISDIKGQDTSVHGDFPQLLIKTP